MKTLMPLILIFLEVFLTPLTARSTQGAEENRLPKKVRLLRETRLAIPLGVTIALRKVQPNTEVEVVNVMLPNLEVRQGNAKAVIPANTTDFFDRECQLIQVHGGRLPERSELAETRVENFLIGKYEVTWAEWEKIKNWATSNGYDELGRWGFGTAGNHPVRKVSWFDAVKWCNARSERAGLEPVYLLDGKPYRTGMGEPTMNSAATGFRLPTETEWVWAARGGKSSRKFTFSGGHDVNAVAWHWGNSENDSHQVGTKTANELGIHDMSGNVWEWCWDANGNNRRFRGGSWRDDASSSDLNLRPNGWPPDAVCDGRGFRLARTLQH